MNYQQALDYMYARLPMFSRVGSNAVKSGLSNILQLCRSLGDPHQMGAFVHVAGTNGKGSVSHMLAAVLQSAGYKTGLYTSPHLKDFRERIKINGEMIAEQEVIAFIEQVQPDIEKLQPSFFEITVAMAFLHFAKHRTDIAIIETGLGGRLDSTNIVMPTLSVITNIGYDHVQILGSTLPEIAAEKAGIIKKGIPVVIGEQNDETKPVFIAKAKAEGSSIFFADANWQLSKSQIENQELVVSVVEKNTKEHKKYQLDLTGQYQAKNVLTVLEACRCLRESGIHLSENCIDEGLRQVKSLTGLHGRWERIQSRPQIILDVAHNESGMRELLNQLRVMSFDQLHIVLGMVKDKDVDTVLQMLPVTATYYFTNAAIPRAMTGSELQAKAILLGLKGQVFNDVNEALENAKSLAQEEDLILVCGSVFLVGEVDRS